MAKKFYCPGCRTQHQKEHDTFTCPDCGSENIAAFTENFTCYNCQEKWLKLPCPVCGTGIPAKAVKGCYVATCVYGSYDCPEVWILRRYRDDVLANSWLGRGFISTYYAISPKLVELFGDKSWFYKIFKPCVDYLVAKLQGKGIKDSPYSEG